MKEYRTKYYPKLYQKYRISAKTKPALEPAQLMGTEKPMLMSGYFIEEEPGFFYILHANVAWDPNLWEKITSDQITDWELTMLSMRQDKFFSHMAGYILKKRGELYGKKQKGV